MWLAFMVDYPSKSFRATDTEAEIDAEIEEFDCPDDEIVKREFPNVSVDDAYALADILQQ